MLRFSRNDYRGVGYVREVIENLVPAMELPGGVYIVKGTKKSYKVYL